MSLNKFEVRTKIHLVFESWFYFGLFELVTGVKTLYELTPSVCVFSVTFKREEFVWVERSYEHLKKSFEELNLEGWSDFQQIYDYDVENYVTYSLVCTRNEPLSLTFFRDKKNTYFEEFLKE